MDQVPKVLKAMVDEWSNDGYIVSFKARPSPLFPSSSSLNRVSNPARNGHVSSRP